MHILQTIDGSYTAYSERFDECYHNVKDGAFLESLKKHVEPAFRFAPKKERLKILDICFGLGYNTLSTLWYLRNSSQKIHIISPELDRALVRSLGDFSYPKAFEPFADVIEVLAARGFYEDERVLIEIFFGDAREVIKGCQDIDIVYQDPFSPKKNPELWSVEYFQDLARAMNDEAVLTTYSIATSVRLGMWMCGLRIYDYQATDLKPQTIASKRELPLKRVDMVRKCISSSSKVIRDKA